MKNIWMMSFMIMALMINVNYAYGEAVSDGTYKVEISFSGGTGRVTAKSPMELSVSNGKMTGEIVLTSTNYTYMIVDGTKYTNSAPAGEHSTFVVPIEALDSDIDIIACTEAMSSPTEIAYVINISSAGANEEKVHGAEEKEVTAKEAIEIKKENSATGADEKSNKNVETKTEEMKTEDLKKEEVLEKAEKELDKSEKTDVGKNQIYDNPVGEKEIESIEPVAETSEKSNQILWIAMGIVAIGALVIMKKRSK